MKYRGFIIVLAALITAFAAFAATRAARAPATFSPSADSATTALMDWLGVATDQRREIFNHDPQFGPDLQKMRDELASQRTALAAALEKPDSPDELITARVEAVLAASNAMERRVTRYLLTVRHHLSADQQQKLFNLCAQGVREGPGWRWRGGRGPGPGPGPGGGGRGMGWGRMGR